MVSAEEDIRRPILPATPEEKQQKKGFLNIFSPKKAQPSAEAELLKEHLSQERPTESIQGAFEEQAAREAEEVPSPSEPPRPDEAPLPPPPLTTPEEEKARSVRDLEEELRAAKEASPKERLITFTIMGGKEAVSLQDLKRVLQQMPPEDFEKRQQDKEFSLWVKTHLFDNRLASALAQAHDKQEAIRKIEEELKPGIALPEKPPTRTTTHEDHVEEHFSKLQADHEHGMHELARAVQEPTAPTTKDYLAKALRTKGGKVAEDLSALAQAIELLEEDTYKNMIATRKEELAQRIRELSEKAMRISSISPANLQSDIISIIKQQTAMVQDTIAHEKDAIAAQAREVIKKEDEIAREQEEVASAREELGKRLEELSGQRAAWEEAAQAKRDELESKKTEIESLIKGQEDAIKDLKDDLEGREAALKEEEQAIEQKREELRGQELRIAEKKQQELAGVEEEKERLAQQAAALEERERTLDQQEASLTSDKEAFESSMKRREELVQQTVDKIISLDEDINSQREKVAKMRRELDTEGFRKYLQQTLREVDTDHIPFKPTPGEQDVKKRHAGIYDRIDACNEAIDNKRLQEAKAIYTDLKKSFEQEPLKEEEKDILYDAIREIYANLHLALLEEQR